MRAAPHRDDFRKNRDRDFVRRDGAEIEAGGSLELRQALGGNAALGQRRLERFGLLAAADEGDVIDVDGERRQQGGFVAAALRRDHDVAGGCFVDRQRVAFDAAVGIAESRLLGRRLDDPAVQNRIGRLRAAGMLP